MMSLPTSLKERQNLSSFACLFLRSGLQCGPCPDAKHRDTSELVPVGRLEKVAGGVLAPHHRRHGKPFLGTRPFRILTNLV